ncbi:MAG: 5-bromo-4-chloroindolyl phosphate hydrolysis family protein [Eubacteriales bacterium]|nr:5-bromo-4-chloroindolyl phosphate hydrolysis family protein [Eubacteriales bacterium]
MKSGKRVILALASSLSFFFLLVFALHWNIFIAAFLALLTYFGVYLVARPQLRIGRIVIEDYQKGEELRALLDDAYGDMEAIRTAGKAINNVDIKKETARLYHTGSKILEYLTQEPQKINLARRFFTYYLDTARGILEKYLKIQSADLRTEEVSQVSRSTQEAMPVLNEAFEKQFANLLANDLLDIEEDIKLLKINLKMEG